MLAPHFTGEETDAQTARVLSVWAGIQAGWPGAIAHFPVGFLAPTKCKGFCGAMGRMEGDRMKSLCHVYWGSRVFAACPGAPRGWRLCAGMYAQKDHLRAPRGPPFRGWVRKGHPQTREPASSSWAGSVRPSAGKLRRLLVAFPEGWAGPSEIYHHTEPKSRFQVEVCT